jgi:hypothetical protein
MLIWEGTTTVPPEKAITWMFDLREDDHGSHGNAGRGMRSKAGDGRRILARTPTRVRVEDTWNGGRFRFTSELTRVDSLTIQYAGQGNGVHGTSYLRAVPSQSGARLTFEGEATPTTALMKVLLPFLGRAFRKRTGADMDNHARDMEEEWRAEPWWALALALVCHRGYTLDRLSSHRLARYPSLERGAVG